MCWWLEFYSACLYCTASISFSVSLNSTITDLQPGYRPAKPCSREAPPRLHTPTPRGAYPWVSQGLPTRRTLRSSTANTDVTKYTAGWLVAPSCGSFYSFMHLLPCLIYILVLKIY